MSFMDKAKEAAEKFKDSDNEQKDKINEYTGGEDNKDKKDKKDK
ncbi:MAG: SAS049 family protein [Staphylococcus epidermidis]|nr:SAS049 family protein [Staphylococcus epidermidis]